MPISSNLAGKIILITGASSGIGRSTAIEFARACPLGGLKLVLAARRLKVLEEVEQQIRKVVKNVSNERKEPDSKAGADVEVLLLLLDVSDPKQVHGFVERLPAGFRDVDILVNNAGLVKGMAQAPNIAEADINTMFATNVTGLINVTQEVLPIFKRRPDGGAGDIVNVGSVAGREGYAGGSVYCATKAAVRSFTDSLRRELIATRIRVMEIDPGQVETEFSLVRFSGDKAKADAVYKGVEPLTPEDIAETIVFMVGRRQNVVMADVLMFPSHQAAATVMHRKPPGSQRS